MYKRIATMILSLGFLTAFAGQAQAGANISGLAGAGIPFATGAAAQFMFGGGVAYRMDTGWQLGAELDATSAGSTLDALVDYYFTNEFFFGVQGGVGLVAPNSFIIGAQAGYEFTLMPQLVLAPKVEYLFATTGSTSTLEALAVLKFYL